MRDSNYRSVAHNRAVVTITTSLYDRRALDVTSDKPLVNSLNHLTYLVSSSAKVRDTLSNDGGIERLVEILHECHVPLTLASDRAFLSETQLLVAWKWTLAFQCLVLIGTRGTEKIRQKVVKAGMLPVIATVLDNYMSLHEGFSISASAAAAAAAAAANRHDHHTAHPDHHTNEPQTATFMNIRFPVNAEAPNLTPAAAAAAAQATERLPLVDPGAETQDPQPQRGAGSFPLHPMDALDPLLLLDSLRERQEKCSAAFFCANTISNLTSEDYDTLTVEQLLKLVRGNGHLAQYTSEPTVAPPNSINNEVRRRYLIINIIKKLQAEKEESLLNAHGPDPCAYDMDHDLQFLSNLYLRDEKTTHYLNAVHSKIAPRNFTDTGIVIPRDDDVVWCLQLLAYISKYPYLKDLLQNTHFVSDMSIRERQNKLMTQAQHAEFNVRQPFSVLSCETLIAQPSIACPMTTRQARHAFSEDLNTRLDPIPSHSPQISDLNLRNGNFDLAEEKLALCQKPQSPGLTEDAEANDFEDMDESEDGCGSSLQQCENFDEYLSTILEPTQGSHSLSRLYDSIIDAESLVSDLDRELALHRLNEKFESIIQIECKALSNTIISKCKSKKQFLQKTWNYDSYNNFDIDDDENSPCDDYDRALLDSKAANLFPLVERFTFLAGTDMYYWSGVIMRNLCRRNDFKGGVRQCGNLECGKWEKYAREFSKCKRCKRTKYCSRECQTRAWHCHKNWCVPSSSSTTSTTTQDTAVTGTEESDLSQPSNDNMTSATVSFNGEDSQHTTLPQRNTDTVRRL